MGDEDWSLVAYAAAAAGLTVWRGSGDGPRLLDRGVSTHPWNPLQSDADAFRLLACLNIDVRYEATPNGPIVECRHADQGPARP